MAPKKAPQPRAQQERQPRGAPMNSQGTPTATVQPTVTNSTREVPEDVPRLVLEIHIYATERIGPHEVRLHRATFTRLKIRPGAYVLLTEDHGEGQSWHSNEGCTTTSAGNGDSGVYGKGKSAPCSAVFQAFVATGACAAMPSDGVGLSEEASSMIGKRGADCFIEPCGTVDEAAEICIVSEVGDMSQSSDGAIASLEVRMKALLRRSLVDKVASVQQRFGLEHLCIGGSNSLPKVVCTVSSIRLAPSVSSFSSSSSRADSSKVRCGLVTDRTHISVSVQNLSEKRHPHEKDDGNTCNKGVHSQKAEVKGEELDSKTQPVDDIRDEKIEGDFDETASWTSTLFIGDHGVGKTHAIGAFLSDFPRGKRSSAASASALSLPYPSRVDITLEHFGTGNAQSSVSCIDSIRRMIRRAVADKNLSDGHVSSHFVVAVFDDLDVLFAATGSPREAHALHALILELLHASNEIWVVASATSAEKLPSSLVSTFSTKFCVQTLAPPSGSEARAIVLVSMLRDDAVCSQYAAAVTNEAIKKIAAEGHGFNQLDLRKVCRVALSIGFNRTGRVEIADQDLLAAARRVRPSVLNTLEVSIPNVRWCDIGGSEDAKTVLKECVEWCLGRQQSIFAHLGLPPPKGVLLYGPPGCSKTMLAKALARESGMNFVSVKGPEVFSKWVGDSEKAVRDVFRQARAAAPCVVFIDELDGMCGHRGSGGVGDRVISQLLTELDGLPAASSRASDSIIFVAATNRPENIDAAVLRPGRIDRKVFVGLPTIEERESIARLHLSKIPCDEVTVNPSIVAARTKGYTGAETVAVCKEAAFQALARSLHAERLEGGDLEAAFAKVRPRISESEVEWYKKWGAERS